MRPFIKTFLALEVVYCFGPLAILLLLGLMMVPIQIAYLLNQPPPLHWEPSISVIAAVAFGSWGLVALLVVLSHLYQDSKKIGSPGFVIGGITLGVLAVAMFNAISLPEYGVAKIVGLIPLLCTAHIVYLSRRFLLHSLYPIKVVVCTLSCVAILFFFLRLFYGGDLSNQELAKGGTFWKENGPTDYRYTLQVSGHAGRLLPKDKARMDLLHPKRITVRDGKMVSTEYAWSFGSQQAGDMAPFDSTWTIDIVFDQLVEAMENGARVRARFDERWGFIEEATVDNENNYSVKVSDFKLLGIGRDNL